MALNNRVPFLCLNMIVKNESKIIKRLLDSVINIIDSYCICDTGSSDNTIEIIKNYFETKGIPGEVFEIPFKDFGFNRNRSLERARQWGHYVLLLDADMILEVSSTNFKKSDIVCDVYQIKQKNGSLEYYNPRIIRTDKNITCVGVTHEYYAIPTGVTCDRLSSIEINDIGDGGAKVDKFERDVKLLHRGLLDEPNNPRYHFYLANSYRDLGNLRKAIKWYKKRINLGGWDEELFVSCLEIGNIYLKLGKPDKSIYWWLEAWLYRKTRAESLYEIIKYYRSKGNKNIQMAAYFYNLAKNIPYPKTDSLFIRKAVYEYLLDYEYSILAYYMNWPIDHYKYLDLLGKCEYFGNVLSNYKFYVKHLNLLEPQKHTFNDSVRFQINTNTEFYPSTPSIIPHGNDYLMNQRFVNYLIKPNGEYLCNYPIISINRRIILDSKFQINQTFDFDVLPQVMDRYGGIEDVKLFPYNNKILFFGTEQDVKSKQLCVSTGLYPIDNRTHQLISNIIPSPINEKCEKNWCYLDDGKSLKIIYKWFPLTIGRIDNDIDRLQFDSTDTHVPMFFKHLRGSTHGITCDNEIWFMTHIVEYGSPRNYYHCIVILDKDTLKYKKHSILFKFEDTPIEYCLGMIIKKKEMILSYSKMDRESIVCVYNRPQIDQLIFP